MRDTYENYVGGVIRNERLRLEVNVNDVCDGICSVPVYSKIENGEYAGCIHVLRALCQRLGLNQNRCGMYFPKAEYDELMDRLYILEDIRDGRTDSAEERVSHYEKVYKDIPLNSQFILFMRGRLAELKEDNAKALECYENAIRLTIPEYESRKNIVCMTIYEAYMILGAARMRVKLGDEAAAYKLYMLLLRYCTCSKVEKWNLVCIYPKTVCELMKIIRKDKMSIREAEAMLEHCQNALGMLIETSRLHYIRPILQNIIQFKILIKSNDDDNRDYRELSEAMENLFREYGHEHELFEWYPYYVDCGFYCVNELIAERRRMHGMSIEELAGDTQSARNVQRIVKGQVSPGYKTSKELLEKLGLKGVLRSDVVVGRNLEVYKLWDELQLCIKKQDFERADNIIEQLRCELDASVEINDIALKYIRLYWDFCENKITASDMMEKLGKLLPFNIDEIGKYRILIKHEKVIIYDYIVCIDMLKKYDKIIDFDMLTLDMQDSLSKKRFASCFEEVSVRCANLYGNAGKFDTSNKIAEEGVRVDIECERMRPLSTLLYCIAWNNGKRGEVTEKDIDLCRCAYQIAKLNENEKRMGIYRKWLENR